jgi:hypothetical protein
LTVNVRPAIVIVPVRGLPVPLLVTEYVTVLLPVPDAPVTTVIHVSLDTAVHVHNAPAVTLIVAPVWAFLLRFWLLGLIENVQPLLCVTVCVWPAIVSVPTRCGPVVAVTVNATEPLPVPLAPPVIVIHGVVVDDTHAHPAGIVTATFAAAPPEAATV